jgi:hypothetical protein
MMYNFCTFMHYYDIFIPLQAYFLPAHKIGIVMVLEKLPYAMKCALDAQAMTLESL